MINPNVPEPPRKIQLPNPAAAEWLAAKNEAAIASDRRWYEANRDYIDAAPPRPSPFDYPSFAEFMEADDEWKQNL